MQQIYLFVLVGVHERISLDGVLSKEPHSWPPGIKQQNEGVQIELILILERDVPSYNFRCLLIPGRSYKVPVSPKFPSPQCVPQFRLRTKELLAGKTPENLYCFAGALFAWGQQKQVNVVRHHVKRLNVKLVALYNALENLFRIVSYQTLQNELAVFRNTDEVVPEIVHCVLGTLTRAHLVYTKGKIPLWRILLSSCQKAFGIQEWRLLMNQTLPVK